MDLLPIYPDESRNEAYLDHPDCREMLAMQIPYYQIIGFHEPWIGYFAALDGEFVGVGGYKGRPKDGKIEIAYGVFSQHEGKGIGTEICRQLVQLARQADPSVRITARTLPEPNASGRILTKNDFRLQGLVWDEEDGEVWEWVKEISGQEI